MKGCTNALITGNFEHIFTWNVFIIIACLWDDILVAVTSPTRYRKCHRTNDISGWYWIIMNWYHTSRWNNNSSIYFHAENKPIYHQWLKKRRWCHSTRNVSYLSTDHLLITVMNRISTSIFVQYFSLHPQPWMDFNL